MWRRQLPAYSPLPLRAVLAGAMGLLTGGERARASVAEALRATYGAKDVLLTDSGTGALTLAIRGCLAGQPDALVALPAYGCYDLATAADGADARVLLYDVEPETLSPNLTAVRRALDRGARAIVLVHLYGVPADPHPIRALMRGTDAWLIEDAAQGSGGSLRGRPLGSFGDVAVLSFGRGKGTTAGRGGALLGFTGRGADLVSRVRGDGLPVARGIAEPVRLAAQWLLGRPGLYAVAASLPFLKLGETIYRPPKAVRGMSSAAASALTRTLPLGPAEAGLRRANAARLLAHCGSGVTGVRVTPAADPGYVRLPLAASPAGRGAVLSHADRVLGIMPGYPCALCDLAGFGERVTNREDPFGGARALAQRMLTVPVHGLLRERDLVALAGRLSARA